jgi:hypothetical protein
LCRCESALTMARSLRRACSPRCPDCPLRLLAYICGTHTAVYTCPHTVVRRACSLRCPGCVLPLLAYMCVFAYCCICVSAYCLAARLLAKVPLLSTTLTCICVCVCILLYICVRTLACGALARRGASAVCYCSTFIYASSYCCIYVSAYSCGHIRR